MIAPTFDQLAALREAAMQRGEDERAGLIRGWLSRRFWLTEDAIKLAYGVLDTDGPLPRFDFNDAMLYESEGVPYDGVTPEMLERVRREAARDGLHDGSTPAEWVAFFAGHQFPGGKLFDGSAEIVEAIDGAADERSNFQKHQSEAAKAGRANVRARLGYAELEQYWLAEGQQLSKVDFAEKARRWLREQGKPDRDIPQITTLTNASGWIDQWRRRVDRSQPAN
ncbi:hypothetical protein [Paraburkholderia tropica]|uniref:hypothetical protein n=1 Tax=Paraburkholderia tropica TaxID=92647 RepID=UPI002AAFE508|nr:hypothetical protein [Paraburkholderia tropica]